MKDLIRIVVVDPSEESRTSLHRTLRGMPELWVAEIFSGYHEASHRAREIGADVTVVALDHEPNQAIELIQALVAAKPDAVVLPASRSTDSSLILRSLRAGAREFLTLPIAPEELLACVSNLLRGRDNSQTCKTQGPRITAVTGAAGGIGCTTLAVNLATILASCKENETMLVDLDLMFGTVDACLDVVPDRTLTDVIQNFERLDLTLLKRSIIQHRSGLFVLPHPLSMQEAAAVDPESLRRLFGMLRASFGTVIIDTSIGLHASDFTAFEISELILIVVHLELLCLRNTARLINLFRQFDGLAEKIKLVANRVGSLESEISLKKAEEILKMPISWQIPHAAKIFQDARIKGVPLGDVARGSRPHQVFLEMARALWPFLETETKPKRGLFAAFL
jgi:pilus assembly protein CpaE